MTELIELSSRIIDDDVYDGVGAMNPMDGTVHELDDAIAVCTGFSHSWGLDTAAGLAVFDTSLALMGPANQAGLRSWRDTAVSHIVYTHGHVDHVGGTPAFLAAAEERGEPRPHIVSHENAPPRFDRYVLTHGYNSVINERQFGARMFPDRFEHPDEVFQDELTLTIGDTDVVLNHDRGETDDHAWAWIPEHRAVMAGDLFIWQFPNAGNPQKVQRYCADWAVALRKMIALEPELFCPAHGLPIAGKERIAAVLDNTASALESLLEQTLAMMNDGARLNEIVHSVRVPEHLAQLPYLRGTYDEPEFVVNNIWRLYGGWYDGNPANLKPPTEAATAQAIAELAGGAAAVAAKAQDASAAGDHRLACQLAEWAATADPAQHAVRAEVYRARIETEISLMSKGIYGWAQRESEAAAGD